MSRSQEFSTARLTGKVNHQPTRTIALSSTGSMEHLFQLKDGMTHSTLKVDWKGDAMTLPLLLRVSSVAWGEHLQPKPPY